MELLRLGAVGEERPYVRAADGTVHDLTPITADVDAAFLGSDGIARTRAALDAGELTVASVEGLRIGAPIARPGAVVCIGMNYAAHAAEGGAEPPKQPIVFFKHPNTVVGPNDDVLVPRGSTKTDWEVELAVIIGKQARYVETDEEALACIAGYAVSNDVSEREFQLERGGQWDKGKGCETFNPLGPWLVTPDEVPDPQALGMRLDVNGVRRQDGTTGTMVFPVAHLIWYVSQFMVLHPGDLINTGTPAGVALGLPDHPYLRAGDVVDLEIDGLGAARQRLVQA